MAEKKSPREGAAEPIEFVGEQPLTDEEKALKEEAYGRLETWAPLIKKQHDEADTARLIYRMKDPGQNPGANERQILQLQTLRSTLDNCIADQMDNMPDVLLIPQRVELTSMASDMNNTVKFIMEQNNHVAFHEARSREFLTTGTAMTQIMWDENMNYGKGDISVSCFPMESVVWDPAAEDVQDARAIIKLSWHPLSWYTEHYPEQAKYIAGDEDDHGEIAMSSLVASIRDELEDRALLMEYWYRRFNAKKKRYTINVAFFAGGALLGVYTDVYAHGMYPFVFDVYSRVKGSMVGEGMCAELVPMMRYINRYADYIDTNLRYSSKARMLTRRGNGIDQRQLADWDQNIVEGDDISEEQGVRWFETKPFTGAATQQMLQFQNDMKMDSGQSQFSRGEVTGGVDAASAIQLLQNAGSKITRLHTQTLNAGFKKIVEQILWLVAEFYDDERSALINGVHDTPQEVNMSAAHLMGEKRKAGSLEPPPYTVEIKVQRLNPAAVQAQNDLFIQAYTMAAEHGQVFPLTALFTLLNVDGKEKVLPVLQEVDTMTQQVNQMAQENEALKTQVANLQTSLDSYTQGQITDVGDLEDQAFGGNQPNANMV